MSVLALPESADLPVLWWTWWFVVGSVVYGLLAVWFWMSGRRNDRAVADEGNTEAQDHH